LNLPNYPPATVEYCGSKRRIDNPQRRKGKCLPLRNAGVRAYSIRKADEKRPAGPQ
jgi:hypothetical protein